MPVPNISRHSQVLLFVGLLVISSFFSLLIPVASPTIATYVDIVPTPIIEKNFDGTVRTFDLFDGAVAVQPQHHNITLGLAEFQKLNMPSVEDIETAVRKHN